MEKEDLYSRFVERNKNAELGGGVSKIEKQHESGKMTARERIDTLLDKGTFVELDKLMVHRCSNFGMDKNKLSGDGVVSGYGKIDGRLVFVYAYDFTVYGGLHGKVEQISADSIQDEEGNSFYLVRVRTEKSYLGDELNALPIIPGMLASADIITGKKTILDYILKPILKTKQYTFTER